MLLVMAFSVVLAGPLGSGWNGIPYGDADVLIERPAEHCHASNENLVAWVCRERVGRRLYDVHYMVEENLYTGVLVSCSGRQACTQLLLTLQTTWSPCLTTNPASNDCTFGLDVGPGGRVVGAWQYDDDKTGFAAAIAVDMELAILGIRARREAVDLNWY